MIYLFYLSIHQPSIHPSYLSSDYIRQNVDIFTLSKQRLSHFPKSQEFMILNLVFFPLLLLPPQKGTRLRICYQKIQIQVGEKIQIWNNISKYQLVSSPSPQSSQNPIACIPRSSSIVPTLSPRAPKCRHEANQKQILQRLDYSFGKFLVDVKGKFQTHICSIHFPNLRV